MDQNKKIYIDYQFKLMKSYNIIKLYGAPAILSIIEVIMCGILQYYTLLVFLIVINISVLFVIADTIWGKYQKKMVVLCGALILSDISIVFLVLSFLMLSSINAVSILYIVFGIALYLVFSIINILNTFKKIKNNASSNSKDQKPPSASWGALGGTIGVLIAKGMVNTMEYQSSIWIFAMISLFVSTFCSVGAQFYLLYYWLKKDENKKMNNNNQ